MAKTALVLSGGGAKGAFQVGAEKYCREKAGYSWDVIAGVSVGALNGVMLASQKYQRLEELWRNLKRQDVYRGSLNLVTAIRLLFGARSVYDNRPLQTLIDREVDARLLAKEVIIGTVSLRSGRYLTFTSASAREDPEAFKDAVFASTCIPVLWPPTTVGDRYQDVVDGGLRNVSPLGDVLDYQPDHIVVINTEPRQKEPTLRSLRTIVEVAERSLEIMLDEIFQSDLSEFLRINALVAQAEAQGVRLHKEDGEPFKRYRCTIIEPEHALGNMLDFSRESLDRWMALGWQQAEEVLNQSFEPATASRR